MVSKDHPIYMSFDNISIKLILLEVFKVYIH